VIGVRDDERRTGVSRFLLAMLLFAALGVAAWRTLDDPAMRQARAVTLAVIASFAVRTYLTYRRGGSK
jgi:heme A synthase